MEQIMKELKELRNHIDQRMDKLDNRMDTLDNRMDTLDNRMDTLTNQMDKLDNSIQSLEKTVQNNAAEFRSHFKLVENKLDGHDKMFALLHEAIDIHVPDDKLPFRKD